MVAIANRDAATTTSFFMDCSSGEQPSIAEVRGQIVELKTLAMNTKSQAFHLYNLTSDF
jgi:hypothetical protein